MKSTLLCFYLLLMAVSLPYSEAVASDELRLIAHPHVLQNHVTERQLKRIFMLKSRTWQNGEPIKLIVFANDNTQHLAFVKQKLNLFPYQLAREWNKLIYSGQASPPMVVSSAEEMLKQVSTTPGAIGYTTADIQEGYVKILEVTTE